VIASSIRAACGKYCIGFRDFRISEVLLLTYAHDAHVAFGQAWDGYARGTVKHTDNPRTFRPKNLPTGRMPVASTSSILRSEWGPPSRGKAIATAGQEARLRVRRRRVRKQSRFSQVAEESSPRRDCAQRLPVLMSFISAGQ
jgi:hypothetical protein